MIQKIFYIRARERLSTIVYMENSAGDEVIDNSSGVRQSAKIVFDDDFLSPVLRNGKKTAARCDDRFIEGQHDKQEGTIGIVDEFFEG